VVYCIFILMFNGTTDDVDRDTVLCEYYFSQHLTHNTDLFQV